MKRNEALEFIRNNSRCVRQHLLNPVPKNEREDDYEPNYLEQRLGNNGTPFILSDYGKHGWDLYFISTGNKVDKSLNEFCSVTGADLQTATHTITA